MNLQKINSNKFDPQKFEKIIDEIIALLVVAATIVFIFIGKNVPSWWATSFGMIITFYFSRKATKEVREQERNNQNQGLNG